MPNIDPEQEKAYQASYRAANKEKRKAYNIAYRAANRDELAAYDRARRPLRGRPNTHGTKNPNFRGDRVGYRAAHVRLGSLSGKACVDCGGPAKDWSLKKFPKGELKATRLGSGRDRLFSLCLDDYEPRCQPCHFEYDGIRGEEHPSSKLTTAQASEILCLSLSGLCSQKSISEKFGVSPDTVSGIKAGKRWNHLSRASSGAATKGDFQ